MESNNQEAQKLKKRIKALEDTRKITRALDSISLVKMRRATEVLKKNKEYFDRIQDSVQDLIKYTAASFSSYLHEGKTGKKAYLVIAGDKGFCGAYNHNLTKFALPEIKKNKSSDIIVYAVGYKLIEILTRNEIPFEKEFVYSSNISSFIDANAIADAMHKLFLDGKISSLEIIYTQLVGGSVCKPASIQALPLNLNYTPHKVQDEDFFKEVEYEPSVDAVLHSLVQQYLNGIIFGSLVHSAVAEHTSRCMAMSNATDNAEELLDKIKSKRNSG